MARPKVKAGSGRGNRVRGFRGVPAERMREAAVSCVAAGVAESVAAPSVEAIRAHIIAQTCPFCGAGPFKMLPVHTNKAHGVDKWELREMAGFATSDALCSPEALAAMSAAYDPQRGAQARAVAAGRTRRPQRWTKAGRERVGNNIAEWVQQHPDEAEAARSRALRAAHAPAARRKQGQSLAQWHEENPKPAEQVAAFRERMQTPEAATRRRAALDARLQGHGTVACYKRGCRCEPCRDAKRRSRK